MMLIAGVALFGAEVAHCLDKFEIEFSRHDESFDDRHLRLTD